MEEIRIALLILWAKFLPSEQLFSSVCRVINILIDDNTRKLPLTLKGFLRSCAMLQSPKRQYYCVNSTCNQRFIGSWNNKCPTCGGDPVKCNFFYYASIGDSLRFQLEKGDLHKYVSKSTQKSAFTYTDVRDGKLFNATMTAEPDSIQLLLNADGVRLFSTSTRSIQPVTIVPLNYPASLRPRRLITSLMWEGKRKPNFSQYVQPLVQELKLLGSEGLRWTCEGKARVTKVFLTLVSCDSVAKPPLQGIKQFNAVNGCPNCLISSVPVSAENSIHRYYPFLDNLVLRSESRTRELAKDATVSCRTANKI